jgi:hypothetical protein
MSGIELGGTLRALKGERAKLHEDLTKLDKAIAVLQELSGSIGASPNGPVAKRTMSAAGRRRIAKAQKLRWAKLKQKQAAKN